MEATLSKKMGCLAILIFVSAFCFGQSSPIGGDLLVTWRSEYVTDAVTFVGTPQKGHEHDWCYGPDDKYEPGQRYFASCAVLHDERGCPSEWFTGYRICGACYRKEHVREIRVWLPTRKTEFEVLDSLVGNLRGGLK